MKKSNHHRFTHALPGNFGLNQALHEAKAWFIIALGMAAAAVIFLLTIQTGDFNLIKEKMMFLKLILRWN